MAACGQRVCLTAVSARSHRHVHIRYLLANASKKRPSVLLHLVRRVTAYRVFVSLHLIDKAGAKPFQIAIGKALSFCVGAFDEHPQRYDRMNERPQSDCAGEDPNV